MRANSQSSTTRARARTRRGCRSASRRGVTTPARGSVQPLRDPGDPELDRRVRLVDQSSSASIALDGVAPVEEGSRAGGIAWIFASSSASCRQAAAAGRGRSAGRSSRRGRAPSRTPRGRRDRGSRRSAAAPSRPPRTRPRSTRNSCSSESVKRVDHGRRRAAERAAPPRSRRPPRPPSTRRRAAARPARRRRARPSRPEWSWPRGQPRCLSGVFRAPKTPEDEAHVRKRHARPPRARAACRDRAWRRAASSRRPRGTPPAAPRSAPSGRRARPGRRTRRGPPRPRRAASRRGRAPGSPPPRARSRSGHEAVVEVLAARAHAADVERVVRLERVERRLRRRRSGAGTLGAMSRPRASNGGAEHLARRLRVEEERDPAVRDLGREPTDFGEIDAR